MKPFVFLIITCFTAMMFCANPLMGQEFCVFPGGTGNKDLQTALTTAGSNGENDVIKLVQGTYNGNFYYSSAESFDLTLKGGYVLGCSARTVDPVNTVLNGDGTARVLALSHYTNSGQAAGSFTVEGVTVQNGGGPNAYYGAGLYVQSNNQSTDGDMSAGNITVIHCIIRNNIGKNSGGLHLAVGSSHGDGGDITVAENVVTGNTAGTYGGGVYTEIYVPEGTPGTITLFNNIVTNNEVTGENGSGGGVWAYTYATGSGIIVTNNTISENSADYGGGLYLSPLGDPVSVYNNIIRGNTASVIGQDIYLNGSPVAAGYNNDYHDMSGTWTNAGKNIDLDPCFTRNGSYHLTSSSPCIDKGTGSAPAIPPTDIDGDNRVLDGDDNGSAVVDMGADEYIHRDFVPNWMMLLMN